MTQQIQGIRSTPAELRELIFDVSGETMAAIEEFASHHGLSLDSAIEAIGYHLDLLKDVVSVEASGDNAMSY